jgi:hypothetical protein
MPFNPSADRLLRCVSNAVILGEDPKVSNEYSVNILNFSDNELWVESSEGNVLIYPFVIGYFNRPQGDEKIRLRGIAEGKEYAVEFGRSDFKRKMNVIYGVFDENQFTGLSAQRMWLQMIVDRSDVIRIHAGIPEFEHKSDDDVKKCWIVYLLLLVIILCIIIAVLAVFLWRNIKLPTAI